MHTVEKATVTEGIRRNFLRKTEIERWVLFTLCFSHERDGVSFLRMNSVSAVTPPSGLASENNQIGLLLSKQTDLLRRRHEKKPHSGG